MHKPHGASVRYGGAFLLVSVIQLCIIHGVVTSDTAREVLPELYADGSDLSPLVSLFSFGVHSLAFSLVVLSAGLYGIIIPFLVMLVMRRFGAPVLPAGTKRRNIRFTLAVALVCLLAGCCFSRFRLIGDTLLMYLPLPAVSWLVFHLGRQED
ncbi:hypothetical protein [Ruminococcus sp.]|uniref:hypothetical protein n=1 Tax=Ruminococcus sp. TaxID=41978 RepID=UPI0025CDAFC1|nr:hypothetical protein [Ruminococcus sp.]MCI5816311.1 hypothetical protein [Ruminococcus sp.]